MAARARARRGQNNGLRNYVGEAGGDEMDGEGG